MPTDKITLSDWLSPTAFAVATFGVSLALYRLVAEFQEGTIAIGLSGWQYAFGVLPWLFVLLGAVAVVSRRIPWVPPVLRRALPVAALVLAALALVSAIVAFADKPDQREFAAAIVQHVDRDEIEEIAGRALTWTPTGSGIGYGFGLYLLTVAAMLALAAAAAQFVPGLAGRSRAAAESVAATTDSSVSPPAAPASGTTGRWQPPVALAGEAPVPATGEAPPAAPAESDKPASAAAAPFKEPSEQGPVATFCVRCGAAYHSPDGRFCTRCGAPRWTG